MQLYKKKYVVLVGDVGGYNMSINDMMPFLLNVQNLELIERIRFWHKVRHHNYYYITHQNTLTELAKCQELFGNDIIFVENLLPITGSVAVGKKLSQTKAYEKVFSKNFHCSKGSDYVVPTWFDYVDLSSKFWLVISTIPLLLQANNYQRLSTLASLSIIVLDLNRKWLYEHYHCIFEKIIKYIKLNIFKERSALYNFCSIFSVRWKYTDTSKRHAYVAEAGEKMILRWYSKLESEKDIEFTDWTMRYGDPDDQHICMEIEKDRAHCFLMKNEDNLAEVSLNRDIYVP